MASDLFKLAAQVEEADHAALPDLPHYQTLARELEDMGNVRSTQCSGHGHTKEGSGHTTESRASTKCPNPHILNKRLGTSKASKKARTTVSNRLKAPNRAFMRWGQNGGAVRRGRMLGRFSGEMQLREIVEIATGWYIANPRGGPVLTEAEWRPFFQHLMGIL